MIKTIDIIIPCYNESKCIRLVYNALLNVFRQDLMQSCSYRILYVDDGSKDDTLAQIHALAMEHDNVKYISFARNFGKEAALYAGLEASDADYVAVMDADLQHPPMLLTEMVAILETGEYDCAGARRVDRKGESRIKSFLSSQFYNVINWVTGMKLVPGMTDYRLMRREVVEAILSLKEKERFTKGIYSWIGFKTKWIEYNNVERAAGDSKWSMKGLWNYAKSGFIAFAVSPLRGVIYLGMITVLVAFLYGIRLLYQTLSGVRPWQDTTTIILLLLFFGGVIITILGIIGEYIARVYLEVKNRPIYITRESNIHSK